MSKYRLTGYLCITLLLGCQTTIEGETMQDSQALGKPVVYQVFTRLFGNTQTLNKPWGTAAENGVGKFDDFSPAALQGIRELGVTHIWYTGVPHHAVIADYSDYGISIDDPDVVKGRAGSPYAVKDYYSVNPDLANDPANRLAEFEQLIQRTHQQGMKVIIDIVPNHVARNYQSIDKPAGITDFGENDDPSLAYSRDNNFYYIPENDFQVPELSLDSQLPADDSMRLADGKFHESPAKWTGNGSRLPQPDANDWYETVKINYGVQPNGELDFPRLPRAYKDKDYIAHYEFWADKSVPDSWLKFEHIAHYWLDKGIDGFRYDMAEMVPVEFWSYLNSSIKTKNPQAFILAEVYNPQLYRDYIQLGKMDYLYDKVEFYDSLKKVMQQQAGTDELELIQASMADIEQHMLHFLENHDEQRIASPEFAGDAQWGLPAMVVSALISRSPTMLYFGQEVGEDGSELAGFGKPSRTSIFDYIGVPAHQAWMNNGKFDSGQLSEQQKALREYYRKLLNLSASLPAMQGHYASLHSANRWGQSNYSSKHFSFARWNEQQQLIVLSSFDSDKSAEFDLLIPEQLIAKWQLADGQYQLTDLLTEADMTMKVVNGEGRIGVNLASRTSLVLALQRD
ncbi:alpha-amylase family protein [Aliiglaciecola sp. LCG003]|uniref:alpha-amylase family protein n=1 Tax=Aliiglaciecola sp. LCG003 TaxID=3053655 RepID=UPI002573D6F6|nr:alpha-amylase family protein [Aliiglaciecola sp. LCG003]WJG07901.1 alpha-amylase family protein [Aliiglaciecola sp. LCG003]